MSEFTGKLSGREYWRSLEQIADSPEYRRFLEQEFPEVASDNGNGISRRKFLSLMAASAALAGLTGCRKPVEKIIPYVQQPEQVIPGIPAHYATTMPFGASAYGLVVECHEGRPTKIEGNELHPSSMGRSNAFMQAEILNLYDPDRSDKVLRRGVKSSWDDFIAFWQEQHSRFTETGGKGLAVMTEEFSSPTLSRLADAFLSQFRDAMFFTLDPVYDYHYPGVLKLGQTHYRLEYRYDKADVILSLDSDFLLTESENIVAAKRFADGRRLKSLNDSMNRLHVVEPDMSTTGAMADHRLRVPRSKVADFVAALSDELSGLGLNLSDRNLTGQRKAHAFDRRWLKVLAGDLMDHKGRCLIVAGRTQPEAVHKVVKMLNIALGNIDQTVISRKVDMTGTQAAARNAATAGTRTDPAEYAEIDTLVIIGGNPVYTAGGGAPLLRMMKKAENIIHLSSHVNETSMRSGWHIPRAHFLESWGDARALDGTLSVIQPMIAPLLGGHTDVEFFNLLVTGQARPGYEVVRETWRNILTGGFEKNWRRVLHDGVYSRREEAKEKLDSGELRNFDAYLNELQPSKKGGLSADNLELIFQVSPSTYDGRYANNGWLQELPHPGGKLTWDNAARINPKTASELGAVNGDVVKVSNNVGEVELPVWIVPGMADYVVAAELGYGRTAAGRVGNGVGANAYILRPAPTSYYASGVKVVKTGRAYKLASTQDHGAMEGRAIMREGSLEEYRQNPQFAREMVEHPPLVGIYNEHDYSRGYQWGMTIDLNACTGCNACTIACQSENNIPVVGKERVLEGREMHWIRLDRYFTGDTDDPQMVFMPMPCQQCENAPCEEVCPVQATSHDSEGLNVMVYNRCIGTRYCSNNCPYKVRRFNFFNYTKDLPEIVRMAMNPDVTMRSRGVMEKCTFCTQRITRTKIVAKREGRTLKDGDVVTACQQACPAGAILFGNINDPNSKVSESKKQQRGYALLAEFNTRPRNTFLARVRNPHPDLKDYRPGKG